MGTYSGGDRIGLGVLGAYVARCRAAGEGEVVTRWVSIGCRVSDRGKPSPYDWGEGDTAILGF